MQRLRRFVAVVGLASLIAVSTSGCLVVGRRGGCRSYSVVPVISHCADLCFRSCR